MVLLKLATTLKVTKLFCSVSFSIPPWMYFYFLITLCFFGYYTISVTVQLNLLFLSFRCQPTGISHGFFADLLIERSFYFI